MPGRVVAAPIAQAASHRGSMPSQVSRPKGSRVASRRRPCASMAPVSCAVGWASAAQSGPSNSSVSAVMARMFAGVPPGTKLTCASGWPISARMSSAARAQCSSAP